MPPSCYRHCPTPAQLVVRRLRDDSLAVFDSDYVREHITHGYAVTVHSVQGVTAGSAHAVLSEATARALFYVAISRGRDANIAYLYQRTTEHKYPEQPAEATHVMKRGSSRQAGQLLRAIVANDEQSVTAHGIALATADDSLPSRVRAASGRRAADVRNRQTFGRLLGDQSGTTRLCAMVNVRRVCERLARPQMATHLAVTCGNV